jgi:hypothetical protein
MRHGDPVDIWHKAPAQYIVVPEQDPPRRLIHLDETGRTIRRARDNC